MSSQQVSLKQLLRDPIYRKWFSTQPLGGFPAYTKFRVYAQVKDDGPWAKKDFNDFKDAYNFVAKYLKKWNDAALVAKNYESRPPVVRKQGRRQYYAPVMTLPGHHWCTYCRRPTVFSYYTQHHAFPQGFQILAYKRRCGVCGIADDAIKRF